MFASYFFSMAPVQDISMYLALWAVILFAIKYDIYRKKRKRALEALLNAGCYISSSRWAMASTGSRGDLLPEDIEAIDIFDTAYTAVERSW